MLNEFRPTKGFHCDSAGKESTCNAGDMGSIPGLGRSPGEGKGYPFQYSGLKKSMDYTAHGVSKSRTGLSDFHFQRNKIPQSCNSDFTFPWMTQDLQNHFAL